MLSCHLLKYTFIGDGAALCRAPSPDFVILFLPMYRCCRDVLCGKAAARVSAPESEMSFSSTPTSLRNSKLPKYGKLERKGNTRVSWGILGALWFVQLGLCLWGICPQPKVVAAKRCLKVVSKMLYVLLLAPFLLSFDFAYIVCVCLCFCAGTVEHMFTCNVLHEASMAKWMQHT